MVQPVQCIDLQETKNGLISNVQYFKILVKSTRNYYRPYHTLPMSITRKFTKEQYEQHFNFDIFSYGCIIEKAISCPSGFDPFILDTLKYIMKKCLETNPEDRLCGMEIIVLLQYLSEYKRKE